LSFDQPTAVAANGRDESKGGRLLMYLGLDVDAIAIALPDESRWFSG